MKLVMSIVMALALSAAVMARQSDQTKPSDQSSASQSQGSASQNQGSQNQATSTGSGDTRMAGKVSSDDKSFTSDSDGKTYTVSNPDALSGHEGQHVVILVRADPDTGTIHITQLALPDNNNPNPRK